MRKCRRFAHDREMAIFSAKRPGAPSARRIQKKERIADRTKGTIITGE
jgi:hypothetical protein